MRKLTAVIIMLAICAGICPAFAARTNLITNGGFEDGTQNWKTVSAELKTADSAASGLKCGEVVMTKEYGRAMNKAKFKRGTTYIISVYVRLKEGKNTASLIVDHRSFGDKKLIKAVAKEVRVSKGWSKLSGTYEWDGEGTGEAYIYVRIGDALTPVTFYMDDLTVEAYKSEPKEFKETVPNANEIFENTGFDQTVEPFLANDAQLTLFYGDGAEDTETCASVKITGKGSNVGQSAKLSPRTKYLLSAYVKSRGADIDYSFVVSTKKNTGDYTNKYIRDYSAENIMPAENIKKLPSKSEQRGEWKYMYAEYEYRGTEEGEAYIALYPSADSGTEILLDKFSAAKTGDITVSGGDSNSVKGFFINNAAIVPNGGYAFYKDTVMMSAQTLAEVLEAEYSFDTALCVIKKGMNTLKIDAYTGSARLNDRIIPCEKAYLKGNTVIADVSAVCSAFGCSADIDAENGTVKITTENNSGALVNTAGALINRKSANIAFLGGAAAYGKGAGVRNETSYRALVMQYLKNRFTDCKFNEINRTLGDTDSGLEVYRIEELMREKPDLVFIDFVPEDCKKSLSETEINLKSIVNEIKELKPQTDIIFLESWCSENDSYYTDGKTPPVAEVYNSVAAQYGMPVINMGLKLHDSSAGKTSEYIMYDCFPNNSGHRLYADLICEFIGSAVAMPSKQNVKAPDAAGLIKGRVIGTQGAELNGFKRNSNVLSGDIGDGLLFEFTGTEIGVLMSIGIDTGSFEYEIDGKKYKSVIAFDENGVRSRHMNYVMLADKLSDGKHTLRLKVTEKRHDMSIGNKIEIHGFLVGNRI